MRKTGTVHGNKMKAVLLKVSDRALGFMMMW